MYAKKSWRLLATPISVGTSPTVTVAWRESAVNTNSTGYGTQITGPASFVGMDNYTQRASMKYYSSAVNNFVDVTNTNTNINTVSSSSSKTDINTDSPTPTFCIITWGDSDIGTILKEQCRRNNIELPSYFHQWINLKAVFRQHFGWEPHGGLQNVVQRCGFTFDGRAHSGLVDSWNTAKIVKKMLQEGYRVHCLVS